MSKRTVSLKWLAMALWIGSTVIVFGLLEIIDAHQEKQHIYITAKSFFQEIVLSRKWNASHGGVYVPVTSETLPNPYLKDKNRDLTMVDGLKLTKVNPAYMTRQISELAKMEKKKVQFHITSLKPLRPENKAEAWEEDWLQSFEKGSKEQGAFVTIDDENVFRYMAPLMVTPECMTCHAEQGYKVGDIRGGISVSVRSPHHIRVYFYIGYVLVAALGIVVIFVWGTVYERKRNLFEATFDSPTPTCITGKDSGILMANDSYWAMFGVPVTNKKTIKCYNHRPGNSCNTDDCPLACIMGGKGSFCKESVKKIDGVSRHFIITTKPLIDGSKKVVGIVQSFQEISELKKIEKALEESNAKLEALSITDGLTNIANRRHFDDVLTKEYHRHLRSGGLLSLIFADIDYFKSYNDTYGHLAGDECLKKVAHVIADAASRAADLPARYGGEEFACILPETDSLGAVSVAEKIRQGILARAIPHKASRVHECVTISIGVATMGCVEGKTASDLILKSDEMLYSAKASGRNRVEVMAAMESDARLDENLVKLVWKDAFCCGNALIDNQHQGLFRLANEFLGAITSEGAYVDIVKIINTLVEEIKIHFLYEERILESCGYPRIAEHIDEHEALLSKSLQLVQAFKSSSVNVSDVFYFLAVDVVKQHMVASDRLYFPFLGDR